jgi:hypothetical protein
MKRRPLTAAADAVQVKWTKAMVKLISLLTFAFILGAVAFGWLSPSENDAVSAGEDITSSLCPLSQVALDEGYGVTRTEMRPVCRNE